MEPAQLEALAPLLAESGAGALAWRRLRPSAGAARPAGSAGAARPAAAEALLHGAHIRQALEARLREQEIESTLLLLQEHGVEPLLVKGWDCARLYPELGLRPFGDVDLLVLPEQARLACELLGVQIDRPVGHLLDLKSRLPAMYGLSLPSMLSLARRVELGRAWAQVPCAEDQLRLLCLHFLRHGAWRPLWLCDIAAALEARPAGFSWPRCLSLDKRRAERVACALSLAHLLLGARLDNTPLQRQAHALPSWLVPAVLKEWAAPQLSRHALPAPLSLAPRRARALIPALLGRWPSPIEAATVVRLPLSLRPLPAQAIFYAGIALRFLQRSAHRAP